MPLERAAIRDLHRRRARGALQSGFSRLIRRMSSRTSCGTGGRLPFRRRYFQVQSKRKPFRCQAMTVSGLTITKCLPPGRPQSGEQHPEQPIRPSQQWPRRLPLHCGELMAKRHELHLERHAASEGIAEFREEEIDNRVHAGDAIQTRPERPGFLLRMRLLGGTGGMQPPRIDNPARKHLSLPSPDFRPLHLQLPTWRGGPYESVIDPKATFASMDTLSIQP